MSPCKETGTHRLVTQEQMHSCTEALGAQLCTWGQRLQTSDRRRPVDSEKLPLWQGLPKLSEQEVQAAGATHHRTGDAQGSAL